jgi:ABC-type transport system involved in multi-copper enzyme maturation permease subunit
MRRTWTLATIVWLEMLRRKDIYVLFIMLAALLVAMIALDAFGLGQVTGYVKDIGLLAAWLLGWILAVNAAIRQLPQEETRGTVFPLLAKPVSRWNLITGKWLGVWAVVAAATLLFYAATWGIVALKGGRFDPLTLCQACLLHIVALAVVVAIGIALSTRMNADAAGATAYVLTGAAFLVVPRIPALLAVAPGLDGTMLSGLYYLLPHFELFDMRQRLVHDWGSVSGLTLAGVVTYGALLTLGFLMLAWLGYRRKRFSRGEIL